MCVAVFPQQHLKQNKMRNQKPVNKIKALIYKFIQFMLLSDSYIQKNERVELNQLLNVPQSTKSLSLC